MADRVEKVTTRVTRTVSVEFTDEQIEAALRKACGFSEYASVEWDISQDYIRSATVISTTVEES